MEEYNLSDVVVTFAGFVQSPTTNSNKKRRATEYVKKVSYPIIVIVILVKLSMNAKATQKLQGMYSP
jgi:hypothetical protein